jgi:hypothetical protein
MSIKITLTGEQAEKYMAWVTEQTVKTAVEQIDDLPKKTDPPAKPKAPPKPRNKKATVTKMPSPEEQEQAEEVVTEDPPEPAAAEDELNDIDGLRARFEQLVVDDYDAAVALIDSLGVDNFAQAIGAGKEKEIAAALAAVS